MVVNDSSLQQSTLIWHVAFLISLVRALPQIPPFLLKYSDGGTDEKNNLENVHWLFIAVFKELDLDMIIIACCTPGQGLD